MDLFGEIATKENIVEAIALMRASPKAIVLTTKSHFHVKRMYASIRGLVVRTITSGKTCISAIKKYGHVTIGEQERRQGGSICRLCFNLLKGIGDRVNASCQKGESSPTAV